MVRLLTASAVPTQAAELPARGPIAVGSAADGVVQMPVMCRSCQDS